LTADIWEQIQKGLFIPDIREANDFFIKKCSLNHLLLIGNCGGAITALIAAKNDNRVKGLALIDVPVNLRLAQQTFADKVAPGSEKADWLFLEYLKRAFRTESWYRFVTFQTDYKALCKTLFLKCKKALFPSGHPAKKRDFGQHCKKYNLNPLFYTSFDSFIKKDKPILFIRAANDKGAPLFEQHFLSFYLHNNNPYPHITVKKIEEANHIYTLYEWQEKLLTTIINWISGIPHESAH